MDFRWNIFYLMSLRILQVIGLSFKYERPLLGAEPKPSQLGMRIGDLHSYKSAIYSVSWQFTKM